MTAQGDYAYSQVADAQLNALELGRNAALYNNVVEICEAILDAPEKFREFAAVITTNEGLRFRTHVRGADPYKIFWSYDDGIARIEAVFPYPV